MMKRISFLFIVFQSCFIQAQFAIVEDKDGFVNVREEQGTNFKIVQKLKNGTVIPIDQEASSDEWILVEYELESNGYIFHDRIKKVEDYFNVSPIKLTDNSINFEINDIKIIIETKKFDKKKHVITKEGDYIYAIDGEEFLGTDGGLPKNEYQLFKISYQNNLVELPAKFYKNLYNVDVKNFRLTYNKNLDQYYLFGTFSDGAATYDAIWVLEKGKIIKHIAQINIYA